MITKLPINGKILHIKLLVNWVTNLFLKYNLLMLHLIIILEFYTEICCSLSKQVRNPKESENVQNIALMKAILIMDTHFY